MFDAFYREFFELLGVLPSEGDGIEEDEISTAGTCLNVRIPESLRQFYRLAGRLEGFVDAQDRFLHPQDWWLDSEKVVFVEENQWVVFYAVDAKSEIADPPVFLSANGNVFEWVQICGFCSEFIRTFLCWQAVNGALPVTGSAYVNPRFQEILERDLSFFGEVNELRAYAKKNCAACLLPWGEGEWLLCVGAMDEKRFSEIESEFGLILDRI